MSEHQWWKIGQAKAYGGVGPEGLDGTYYGGGWNISAQEMAQRLGLTDREDPAPKPDDRDCYVAGLTGVTL